MPLSGAGNIVHTDNRKRVMTNENVRLTGIDISLRDLVVLFVKVAIAAIPAMILITLVYMVIGVGVAALFMPSMMAP
jgi:hypothetical protein